MSAPLNIRCVAKLLAADSQLEDAERYLRRIGERRIARQISDVREILGRALSEEQSDLYALFAGFAEDGSGNG